MPYERLILAWNGWHGWEKNSEKSSLKEVFYYLPICTLTKQLSSCPSNRPCASWFRSREKILWNSFIAAAARSNVTGGSRWRFLWSKTPSLTPRFAATYTTCIMIKRLRSITGYENWVTPLQNDLWQCALLAILNRGTYYNWDGVHSWNIGRNNLSVVTKKSINHLIVLLRASLLEWEPGPLHKVNQQEQMSLFFHFFSFLSSLLSPLVTQKLE